MTWIFSEVASMVVTWWIVACCAVLNSQWHTWEMTACRMTLLQIICKHCWILQAIARQGYCNKDLTTIHHVYLQGSPDHMRIY